MVDPTPEPLTILVVEDDQALSVGLDLHLTAEGFRVLLARDGETGLQLALDESPSLILLDLRLPGLTGWEVLEELRDRGRTVPVLILSARGEERDKVDGLNLGADDYVTKPFGINELVARIKALLRRTQGEGNAEQKVCFGPVEINLSQKVVRRGGADVRLTAREYELLAYLVAHPGRVLSREALLAAAWGYGYEGTLRTVDNFVRRLRAKLEEDPTQPQHLLTVHGAGYRWVP